MFQGGVRSVPSLPTEYQPQSARGSTDLQHPCSAGHRFVLRLRLPYPRRGGSLQPVHLHLGLGVSSAQSLDGGVGVGGVAARRLQLRLELGGSGLQLGRGGALGLEGGDCLGEAAGERPLLRGER